MSTSISPELAALLNGPALQPPPGVESNFVNPYDGAHGDYVITAIAIFVPTLVLNLRIYSRAFVLRQLRADDYFLVAGWAFYIGYCALAILLARDGIARHFWDIRIIDLQPLLYHMNLTGILYGIVTALVKTSILLQLLNIFCSSGQRNFMFWGCWGLIGFICSYYFAGTVAEICACSPREKFWTPWMPGGHCVDSNLINIASGSVNTVSDLIIIVLPQSSIWRLKMSFSKKLRASGIFLIGLVALASSVIRLYYSWKCMVAKDFSWNMNIVGRWTCAEFITTFVCSCLPSMAHLINHWKPTFQNLARRPLKTGLTPQQQQRSRTTPRSISTEQYMLHNSTCATKSVGTYTVSVFSDAKDYRDGISDEERSIYDHKIST